MELLSPSSPCHAAKRKSEDILSVSSFSGSLLDVTMASPATPQEGMLIGIPYEQGWKKYFTFWDRFLCRSIQYTKWSNDTPTWNTSESNLTVKTKNSETSSCFRTTPDRKKLCRNT